MGKFSSLKNFVEEREEEAIAAVNGSSDAVNLEEAIAQLPVIEIPISKLRTCRWQPPGRHSESELTTFGESVESIGITDPIIVRPHPEHPGDYEILGGHKRKTVAERKGYDSLLSRIVEANDEVAHAIFASGLLHTTATTELQETDIVLSYLSAKLNMEIPEVATLLRRGFDDERGHRANNVVGTPEWTKIMKEYQVITNLPLGTFCNHRLVWLKVPPDILAAVREGKIPANNAKAIARIEDDDERAKLLEEAIDKKLSVSQIKERLQQEKPLVVSNDDPIARAKTVYRRVKVLKDDPKKLTKLKALLDKIDALLEEL